MNPDPGLGVPGEEPKVLETLLSKAIFEKDREALRALMSLLASRYYSKLFRSIYGIASAKTETAQEVLQGTFLRFMEAVEAGELKEVPEDVLTYVRNSARDALRRRHRRHKDPLFAKNKARVTELKEVIRDPKARGPHTELRALDEIKALDSALATLSTRERQVLEKRRENVPLAEIAKDLGIDEDSVKKLLFRIREKLLREIGSRNPTVAMRLKAMEGQGRKPKRHAPSPKDLRAFCERLPKEFRDVVLPLHFGGKGWDEVTKSLGEETAAARRDGAYQILTRHFGVEFPEAFLEAPA